MHQQNTESTPAENTTDTQVSERPAPDTTRDENTVIVPREKLRSRMPKLTTLLLGVCGAVAAFGIFHACNTQKTASTAETSVTRTVFAGATPRKLKMIDASKCRKDQIRMVGDTLVTDSDCTTYVYEDDK